jgi:hypothetical protein
MVPRTNAESRITLTVALIRASWPSVTFPVKTVETVGATGAKKEAIKSQSEERKSVTFIRGDVFG